LTVPTLGSNFGRSWGYSGRTMILAALPGWFDVAVPHEDEQLVAGIDDDCIAQMATLGVGWLELEQPVELALEFARVLLYRAIGEIGPTAANFAGVLQELLECRTEHGITGINRVLGITDQMGKAAVRLPDRYALNMRVRRCHVTSSTSKTK
jgi:hypothetical protein